MNYDMVLLCLADKDWHMVFSLDMGAALLAEHPPKPYCVSPIVHVVAKAFFEFEAVETNSCA